jgi:hypothetical protein
MIELVGWVFLIELKTTASNKFIFALKTTFFNTIELASMRSGGNFVKSKLYLYNVLT